MQSLQEIIDNDNLGDFICIFHIHMNKAFVDKFLFSFIIDCFALNLWNFISLISLQYPINSVLCNKLVCGRFTSRNRDVIKILSANVAKWF